MNPVVSVDVGQHQCWVAQSLEIMGSKGRILIGGGYGSMGCALPYAIGASISLKANKQNNVVYCITGDGGFQMNIQELQTVFREKLPIKIIILNNKVLGKIWETQHKNHGDRFEATAETGGYSVPDFEKIAKAYGVRALTLDNYEDLDKYKRWFHDKKPCLINVILPEAKFLSPKTDFIDGIMKPDLDEVVKEKINSILS